MEVITSHINLDFDGFASMIAAKKLYPNAQIVLPNVVSKEVRNFLSLYRGSLDLREFYEIDTSSISKLIIVDACAYDRVVDFFNNIDLSKVEIVVYDHHINEHNMIKSNYSEIRKIGACTSLLINKIIEKGIEIKPFEATILALGIYSDTNCLTFSSTTVDDASAVTYLLQHGAYLDVVSTFVGQPLSIKQQEAFSMLVSNIESYYIKGFEFGISVLEFEEYIDELAYLTHRLLSIKDYDAVFTVVSMRNRIYIVGRSTVAKINIDRIVKYFDGAGHPKAGSAMVKDKDISHIKQQLVGILNESIEPSITARDIMSYPVKTVAQDISLKEVNNIMLRYGHTGLPVVSDGKVIGMITRRDIDKAIHHGYGHSPVKAYMSRRVISIQPDTPIREIQHKLIEYNIGRLPIIENNQLIGIVTRTDILKQTFGENSPNITIKTSPENNRRLKRSFLKDIDGLQEDIKNLLLTVGEIGDANGYSVYVVGGFVRDLILGNDNLDLDIVVVGDGIHLAKKLCERYSGSIKVHKKFQTAVLKVLGKYKIDIVTARREFYEYPAALPTVEKGSIKSDLYRRDFTINSMAVSLNKKSFGKLIDYFGGQRDLQDGLIRVLYNMSFIEDPTRILRAIRFEQRYNFKIEEQTYEYISRAINSEVLEQVSDERITDELLLILKEENADKAVLRMINIGLLQKLYPLMNINKNVVKLLDNKAWANSQSNYDIVLVYLLILFSYTDEMNVNNILQKIKLPKYYRNIVVKFAKEKELIIRQLESDNTTDYKLINILKAISVEVLMVIRLFLSENALNKIDKYNEKLKNIRLLINGKTLKELGIRPGPRYREIIEKLFEEKLNNRLHTLDDEIEYIKQLMN